MQISVDKINELLAQSGSSLADQPELAAQIANLNERLAALPEFTPEVFQILLQTLMGRDHER